MVTHGALVDVTARAAPVKEILDLLARRTGMNLTYEGPPPRVLVTMRVEGVTPAEAVRVALDGQGINYAFGTDPRSGNVTTIIVVARGSATPRPGDAPAPPAEIPGAAPLNRDEEIREPPALELPEPPGTPRPPPVVIERPSLPTDPSNPAPPR